MCASIAVYEISRDATRSNNTLKLTVRPVTAVACATSARQAPPRS